MTQFVCIVLLLILFRSILKIDVNIGQYPINVNFKLQI